MASETDVRADMIMKTQIVMQHSVFQSKIWCVLLFGTIGPCFSLKILEYLSQLSMPASSFMKFGWTVPVLTVASCWLIERIQTWKALTCFFQTRFLYVNTFIQDCKTNYTFQT